MTPKSVQCKVLARIRKLVVGIVGVCLSFLPVSPVPHGVPFCMPSPSLTSYGQICPASPDSEVRMTDAELSPFLRQQVPNEQNSQGRVLKMCISDVSLDFLNCMFLG